MMRHRSISKRRPSELPTVYDLQMNTSWRPSLQRVRSPSDVPIPTGYSDPFLEMFGPVAPTDQAHAVDAAIDIARFREATNQAPLPGLKRRPSIKRQASYGDITAAQRREAAQRLQRHVVEVSGDPTGVANGTYRFTEKENKEPFFTRTKPYKATLAQRQSHGMWFLIAWGKDKDGKDAWGDYCSPHDGELPPESGWRKCTRTGPKLAQRWVFGDEVPIKVLVVREQRKEYSTPMNANAAEFKIAASPAAGSNKSTPLNQEVDPLAVEAAKLTLKEPVPSVTELYKQVCDILSE